MKRSFLLFWSIVAVLALISAACGGDSESETTATTGTTATTTSTPTTTSTAAPTTSAAMSSTAEPTTTAAPGTVTVYFSTGDGSDCGEVSPFTRPMEGDDPLGSALVQLLAGPTEAEIEAGASSFFSSETIDSLSIIDFGSGSPKPTRIGFEDLPALIPNASTSCGSEALLAQLNNTVLQYVPKVRYELFGSCPMFANWLQRECMDYTSEGAEPAVLTTLERAAGSGCAEWWYGALDGRWFGYVDSTTDSEIMFDLACWFDGDAAVDAASEDGEESPPPNGYHVRNDEDTLESIRVAPSAAVTWIADIGDPATQTTGKFSEWKSVRDSRPEHLGVWLRIRGEEVIEIVEQYVP